jgi:hypothetical protein
MHGFAQRTTPKRAISTEDAKRELRLTLREAEMNQLRAWMASHSKVCTLCLCLATQIHVRRQRLDEQLYGTTASLQVRLLTNTPLLVINGMHRSRTRTSRGGCRCSHCIILPLRAEVGLQSLDKRQSKVRHSCACFVGIRKASYALDRTRHLGTNGDD